MIDRAAVALKFRGTVVALPRDRCGPSSVPRSPPHLLAVLGEALSNASRHADATAVDVVVSVSEEVSLLVRDNGRGISGDAAESGLANIRHRAEGVDGQAPSLSTPRWERARPCGGRSRVAGQICQGPVHGGPAPLQPWPVAEQTRAKDGPEEQT